MNSAHPQEAGPGGGRPGGGHRGRGSGERRVASVGDGVSSRGDESVLKLDGNDGGTTLNY